MNQPSSLEALRHSASHIMAAAVLRLFPEAKLDIGPATETGFYYDFDLGRKFTAEDLEKIEAEMRKITAEDQPFERAETTREEAEEFFRQKDQCYKLARLEDIPEGEPVSYYAHGEFTDLCAGPHVASAGQVKAFKLLGVAGAYHKGDERNKQLQRIYGTAFPSQKELDEHLRRLEEAKKRDHRKIGKDMRLFLIDEAVGPGMVLWAPKGAILRQELEKFIMEELVKQGYEQVFTPHIGKLALYRSSGHYPYYSASQFPPLVERAELARLAEEGCSCAELSNRLESGEIEGYLLKPMNCPMHVRIYASEQRSYRGLPVRLAEFGAVYRWEQSGEISGMTRVRGFTQDDAHIFCAEDQLLDEISGCLDLVKFVFGTLGMSDYRVRLGLRDPGSEKYVGGAEAWDKAEAAVREGVKMLGVPFTEEPGEAAFYGPKIDFVVKDVIGREWQLGTIQVDYNLPERFGLEYIGADNQPHRPVMIHRAPFGSFERFAGVLIEHFAGNFPTWLAPEQARILTITGEQLPYANEILKKLKNAKIRAGLDAQPDKLGAKIRRAELEKVPYMLIAGKKEAASGKVSVRSRVNKDNEGTCGLDDLVKMFAEEISERRLPRA